MDSTAKMNSKGQVTLPKSVRDTLGLRERDSVLFPGRRRPCRHREDSGLSGARSSVRVPAGKRSTTWDEVRNSDFFSARIGCQTYGSYGMDLAALCIKPGRR